MSKKYFSMTFLFLTVVFWSVQSFADFKFSYSAPNPEPDFYTSVTFSIYNEDDSWRLIPKAEGEILANGVSKSYSGSDNKIYVKAYFYSRYDGGLHWGRPLNMSSGVVWAGLLSQNHILVCTLNRDARKADCSPH